MTEHAAIGPSALARLLNCPGSHNISKGRPQGAPSIYAAEGTVAHHICETCLDKDKDPKEFLGDTMTADEFWFTVDEEMVEGCTLYVDHCRSLSQTASKVLLEQRVDLAKLWAPKGPPEPIFGTADFISWDEKSRKMYVVDFKYGRGDVDPTENQQAQAYALGAMLTLGVIPGTVDIYIVQPRSTGRAGIKHWATTGVDLYQWGSDTLVPGVDAMQRPDAPLTPGDHCKFCPALAVCPALQKTAREISRTQFDPIPPEPATLADEDLGDILDRIAVLENWIKAVRGEASSRLDKGTSVPGWKLVPKRALRKFTDEKDVRDAFAMAGVEEGFTKETLLSPAQIQKKFPKVYEDMEAGGLVDKTSSGTTLAPDHDPRDALIARRAKDEFQTVNAE